LALRKPTPFSFSIHIGVYACRFGSNIINPGIKSSPRYLDLKDSRYGPQDRGRHQVPHFLESYRPGGDSPQGWQLNPSWQDLHCFKGCSSSGVAGRTSTTFTE